MDFLIFDKYAAYIWASYLITFAVIGLLFFNTKSARKQIITKLRIKYIRDKNND
ncbi:MAG: heme exporter protein CcmD [Candidatus Thioglobus sp.]|nr:MAG: heme exporter protein CcmD [Candidatus Thioglobus sp.]